MSDTQEQSRYDLNKPLPLHDRADMTNCVQFITDYKEEIKKILALKDSSEIYKIAQEFARYYPLWYAWQADHFAAGMVSETADQMRQYLLNQQQTK